MPVQTLSPSDAWSHDRQLVFENETTTAQPALASFGGHLWPVWTGALRGRPLRHHLRVRAMLVFAKVS